MRDGRRRSRCRVWRDSQIRFLFSSQSKRISGIYVLHIPSTPGIFVKRSASARDRSRSSVRRFFAKQSSSCSPAMKRRTARSCVTHWQLHLCHRGFPATRRGDFPTRQQPDAHVRAEWQPFREKPLRRIGASPGAFSRRDRAFRSSFVLAGPELPNVCSQMPAIRCYPEAELPRIVSHELSIISNL